jgi:hypothetical protein
VEQAIRPLLTERTEIIRLEGKDGVTLRCSAQAADGTIRLVEIRLVPARGGSATGITIGSAKFAFFGRSRREPTDYDTEQNFARAIGQKLPPAVLPAP